MTDNLQSLLDQIDALKAEIDALPPMPDKAKDLLWRKYRLEWNYNSNHIEGNTLTYGETELLLIFDKITGDHTTREVDEMRGHDVAIKLVSGWAQEEDRLINQADIRNLNEILLVKPFYADAITTSGQKTRKQIVPGKYKELPNHVKLQSGETFYYAEPDEVEPKMQELLNNYAETIGALHPVVLAAKIHYEFVLIHPFDDGNGRVSRLLMNYHLLKNDLAPIIIKSDDKSNYLSALNKADTGDFNSFAEYIAQQEIWSLELMLKATKGETVEEIEDWKKELSILNKNILPSDKIIKGTIDRRAEVAKNSIQPLIIEVKHAIESVAPMFLYFQVEVGNNGDEPLFTVDEDENRFLPLLWALDSYHKMPSNTSLSLKSKFRGLKTSHNPSGSIIFIVHIAFEEFQYIVSFPNGNITEIKKHYFEDITKLEIDDRINSIGKYLVESIKKL